MLCFDSHRKPAKLDLHRKSLPSEDRSAAGGIASWIGHVRSTIAFAWYALTAQDSPSRLP
jgi:hypothetical protein